MMERHEAVMKTEKALKRSWQFDLLRIISMLLVMLFHYTSQFSSKFYNPGFAIVFPQRCATFGIAVFLVLIGFFSYKSSCNEKQNPWEYLIKRAKRLLPTFWLCLIITSIVVSITKFADVSVKQFVLNFFLINRFVNVPFIDGAYWYMLIVVAFAVFVFISKCLKEPKRRSILYALYSVVYVLFGFIDCFVRRLPTIMSFALFDYINKCLAGLLIAYLWTNKNRLTTSNRLWGMLSIALLLGGEFLWMAPNDAVTEIAAVLVVVAVVVFGDRLYCSSRLSSTIGMIAGESYFIYLIHQQIGYVVLKNIIGVGVNCNVALIFAFLTVAILAIGHYVAAKALNTVWRKQCT